MSALTRYGDFWGRVPQTGGHVYWVAPSASYTVAGRSYTADDGNDGLDPRRALLTPDRAWNLVTADVGDVIVLLPGSHSTSGSIAADVAGVMMMGLPSGRGNFLRQKTVLGAVTGNQNVNVTAADIEIAYLHFIPVTADSAVDLTADADRLHIHDCSFDMATPAANTGTIGIDTLGAAANVLIDNCYFECDGAQGAAIVATALLDSVIQNCTIMQSTGTWAAAIVTGAATDRLVIRDCDFAASNATMTIGINGTAATIASGVTITRCHFSSSTTVGIDGYGAGEADISENYAMGVGSTDGGVLIVAIT